MLWLEVTVGMKVAISILCAVVLLVPCATCNRAEDTKHLEVVIAVLHSYYAFCNKSQQKYNLHLEAIQSHLNLLEDSNAFELKFDKVTQTSWYGQSLHFGPGYCPTTTMLACGEADVPVEFCLQLLHRAKVFVEASREYFDLLKLAPDNEVDAKPESMHTVAASGTTVRTQTSMPASSSRKRHASSIEREEQRVIAEQKLAAEQQEVKKLLEKRPPPQRDMLVEERLKVLMIKETTQRLVGTTQYGRSAARQDRRSYAENLKTEKNLLLKEKNDSERKAKEEELWQKEGSTRRLQITSSLGTLAALAVFPYTYTTDDDYYINAPSRVWMAEQEKKEDEQEKKVFRDIARNCYPEQFIVCGQKIREAHPAERDAAVLKCFQTIRKYNDFRRIARDAGV